MKPSNSTPVTLILVEDDLGHATLFKNFLKRHDLMNPLIHFDGGGDAVRFVKEEWTPVPALMILDLNLPLCHGSEVLSQIREYYDKAVLPIFILSTTMDEVEISRAERLNCQGCLRKPLEQGAFNSAVSSLGSNYHIFKSEDGLKCLHKHS